MLLKMMREELMLQWPDSKSGAQFREDGGPYDTVSALQCPVLSHQQGVNRLQVTNAAVHVTKSSVISFAEFPSPQILTKLLIYFYIHTLKRSIFIFKCLTPALFPRGSFGGLESHLCHHFQPRSPFSLF